MNEPTTMDFAVGGVSESRQSLGRLIIRASTFTMSALVLMQTAKAAGFVDFGFGDWRPIAGAIAAWAFALCAGLMLSRGQRGVQAVFLLPAVLVVLAFVIFPTFYAVFVSFHDWNLSGSGIRHYNGLDNFRKLLDDVGYWNSLKNMVYYVLAVLAQYAVALLLAVLLNQNIRGQKFFRVVFLLPFMLSPVAVSFIIGKAVFNSQYGPLVEILDRMGFGRVSFFENPWMARLSIMIIDAWYSIPFVMILLLAGLQAIPGEILESARVDGAGGWKSFRSMTFPLLLPVSLTALILRVIFELKLLDVVRVVTGGGPGNSTDSVSLFILREGIEKTNVGYATALSTFYLVIIITLLTAVLWLANKVIQRVT